MKTTKFKVLMYNGIYVDQNRLDMGIYMTQTPSLFRHEETIESLRKQYERVQEMMITYPTQKHFDNLQLCKLVAVELHFLEEQT